MTHEGLVNNITLFEPLEELQNLVAQGGTPDLLALLEPYLGADALVRRDDALARIRIIEQAAQDQAFPLEMWLGEVLGAALRLDRADVAAYLLQRPELLAYVKPAEQLRGLTYRGLGWALYRHRQNDSLSRVVHRRLQAAERSLVGSLSVVVPDALARYLVRAL